MGTFSRAIFYIPILLFLATTITSCFPNQSEPGFFMVTSNEDAPDRIPGDGFCQSTLADRLCTLRAAIDESNADSIDNTIQLGADEYLLSIDEQFLIEKSIRIRGDGSETTKIDGRNTSIGMFSLTAQSLSLVDLSIINGGGNNTRFGGTLSIDNSSIAILEDVVIRDSFAALGGGAVRVRSGILSLTNSTIANSQTGGAFGGAIYVGSEGSLFMRQSTLEGNTANRAGAIYNFGTIDIKNSTISGNRATSTSRGTGGIVTAASTSQPITSNTAVTILNNVTIFENATNTRIGRDPDGSSGGLNIDSSARRTSISNTIIAGNTAAGIGHDCLGELSGNHNLIQNPGANCRFPSSPATGFIEGVNPQLGPLGLNGGQTRSHRPANGSSAINAGKPEVSGSGACEEIDQTGRSRELATSGRRCDIGAIETM